MRQMDNQVGVYRYFLEIDLITSSALEDAVIGLTPCTMLIIPVFLVTGNYIRPTVWTTFRTISFDLFFNLVAHNVVPVTAVEMQGRPI
jgi:hypothetical protein